jgi:hypothetical protein
MSQIERTANEAVYILQLSSMSATRYIQRNARCSEGEAQSALRQALTWYRNK